MIKKAKPIFGKLNNYAYLYSANSKNMKNKSTFLNIAKVLNRDNGLAFVFEGGILL